MYFKKLLLFLTLFLSVSFSFAFGVLEEFADELESVLEDTSDNKKNDEQNITTPQEKNNKSVVKDDPKQEEPLPVPSKSSQTIEEKSNTKVKQRFNELPNYSSNVHQSNWMSFADMANKIENYKDNVEKQKGNGVAGKKIICTLSDGDKYGFYFLGHYPERGNKQALVFRFFPGNALTSSDAYGIHEGLLASLEQYADDDVKFLYVEGKKIARDTLKYIDGPNRGNCEIAEKDLYDYFKSLSDKYSEKLNSQKEKQLKKNKL